MKPLFCVGEEVILQSSRYAELNGDCIITKVEEAKRRKNTSTGEFEYTHGYRATVEAPTGNVWSQTSLKKKYKPGDSFDSIMDKLKQPITA